MVSPTKADEFYEIRSYILGENGDEQAIDEYLSSALLPALEKLEIGPIGVLSNAENDATGSRRVVLVIPYTSAEQVALVKKHLNKDEAYQTAARSYLDRTADNAPYQRIESELLIAMDCMPALKVDQGSLTNNDRVYELRIYESANEGLGELKVHMFNNGEVPIFLDSGIQPIFIGHALIGPYTPNLTYLTVYPSDAAREKAWVAFRGHPDWQVLKKVKKYQGTVSKIHKYLLVPKSFSKM
jgi:hypothetical protein